MDQPFDTPVSGQASWDDGLSANFQAIERGYHITERAGTDISTGRILTLNSGGFFQPYDPTVTSMQPVAYSYLAAASGDSMTALGWGIVRSLGINSPVIPGQRFYTSALTPGLVVSNSPIGPVIGIGLTAQGILFNPAHSVVSSVGGGGYTPTYFVMSTQVNAVVGSLHTFTQSLGLLQGWNRKVRINSNSGSFIELKLYADAGLTDLQYSTISGGVSGVGSFYDRAGWPIDTNSGTLYGTVKCLSADVASATINMNFNWQF
jgi:hypothetical protein